MKQWLARRGDGLHIHVVVEPLQLLVLERQIERLRLRHLQHRSMGNPHPNQQVVDEHMLFPLLHARAGGGMPVKVVLAPPTGSAPEVCLTVDECVLINMGVRTVIYAEPPVTIDKQIPGANGPF